MQVFGQASRVSIVMFERVLEMVFLPKNDLGPRIIARRTKNPPFYLLRFDRKDLIDRNQMWPICVVPLLDGMTTLSIRR